VCLLQLRQIAVPDKAQIWPIDKTTLTSKMEGRLMKTQAKKSLSKWFRKTW